MGDLTKHVAFLRGINVGGNKLIQMDALAEVFRSSGFRNVRTYIASGNVLFDTRSSDRKALAKKIERSLAKTFGHDIAVVVFTLNEIATLVKRNPFKQVEGESDVILFVTLLAESVRKKLSIVSKTENLEVVALRDRAAFIVGRRKRTGWFGFPNNFIEKEFGVAATTRNWSSLKKLVAFASQQDKK